jgi:outer membrane protein OmpA-like peptidoglycan-associated protein
LAAARANEVKAYLNRVWGIEDARVRIETSTGNCAPTDATQTGTEAGYEENRRVGFSSNDPVILAPVIRNRFLEPVLVSPSGIELTAHIPADLQVATWNEHADANGTTLTQSGGRSVSKPVDHQFTDDDVRDISKGDAITGTLNIDDIQGHASRASASLPIILDTLPISVQRLTLTLFQISQDRIRPTDEPPLRQFFQDLKPTDELSIKGYTDDIGGLDLNMKLSGQRAESVRAFYGRESGLGKILFSGGVGPTQRVRGVTGYTTPEERFLSRTVAIEIRRHM